MASDCPFCLQNKLLKKDIIYENEGAFVIEAMNFEGNYLIIPKQHAETIGELPDTWWADFKQALQRIPNLSDAYNVTLNIGAVAGQTVKHLHFWIVPRQDGQPASGKGLATLITLANQA